MTCDVRRGDRERGGRDVRGVDLRVGRIVRGRDRDAAAARADVEHAVAGLERAPRRERTLEDFRERRARHEHALVDGEAQIRRTKLRRADRRAACAPRRAARRSRAPAQELRLRRHRPDRRRARPADDATARRPRRRRCRCRARTRGRAREELRERGDPRRRSSAPPQPSLEVVSTSARSMSWIARMHARCAIIAACWDGILQNPRRRVWSCSSRRCFCCRAPTRRPAPQPPRVLPERRAARRTSRSSTSGRQAPFRDDFEASFSLCSSASRIVRTFAR